MGIRAFAGWEDQATMPPGGIRYDTFVPRSFKTDYLPALDFRLTEKRPAWMNGDGSGVSGWLDELIGPVVADAGAATTDAISSAIAAQIPVIVNHPVVQRQINQLRAEVFVGGLLLAGTILGGVYLMKK